MERGGAKQLKSKTKIQHMIIMGLEITSITIILIQQVPFRWKNNFTAKEVKDECHTSSKTTSKVFV